jgi:hypothetical protein
MVIRFLPHLADEINYPLVVIWNHASIHCGREVKAFLKCGKPENLGRIHLAAQPSYSSELNADDWMKYHQLKKVVRGFYLLSWFFMKN